MPWFIQFRIHPSVGIARMGDSSDVYYIAPDIPQYMQEEMPELRFKPHHRTKPPVAPTAPASPSNFKLFEDEKPAASRKADNNKFKDKGGKIIPQAARFRVFAYVYTNMRKRHPRIVFEVLSAHADIKWKIRLANLKGQQNAPKQFRMMENTTEVTLNTATPEFRSKKIASDIPGSPVTPPSMGYAFLERKQGAIAEVSGRLHLLGNEGEITPYNTGSGFTNSFGNLWHDDIFDSQADGSIEAEITPKNQLFLSAQVQLNAKDKLRSLSFGTKDPIATDGATITAMPAWAIVGLPNYTPDMSHFVSLWDLGLSSAINSIGRKKVKADLTHHKLIRRMDCTADYRRMDYHVHIHPQLCLFRDVNWVSGSSARNPGHNTTLQGTGDATSKVAEQIEKGGIRINPRDSTSPVEATWPKKAVLANRRSLQTPDPAKAINEWVKFAIVERLRPPDTLYKQKRQFYEGGAKSTLKEFPRHLGRRADYISGKSIGDIGEKEFPASYGTKLPNTIGRTATSDSIPGNLKPYHSIVEKPTRMCGSGGPPTLTAGNSHPAGYDDAKLEDLDDMYWPINNRNMPLLRELAYTHIQYDQFKLWSGKKTGIGESNIINLFLTNSIRSVLNSTSPDHERSIEKLLKDVPELVPSMIDMAAMETVLGGSFLPGIEVGLEAGRRQNWTLYEGANKYFPDVRFERSRSHLKSKQHFPGRLTKDLAIPWQVDFVACDEEFWPTSRPGQINPVGGGAARAWMIREDPMIFPTDLDYFKTYWKKLGFMRRQANDSILEDEKT